MFEYLNCQCENGGGTLFGDTRKAEPDRRLNFQTEKENGSEVFDVFYTGHRSVTSFVEFYNTKTLEE